MDSVIGQNERSQQAHNFKGDGYSNLQVFFAKRSFNQSSKEFNDVITNFNAVFRTKQRRSRHKT